MQPRALPPAWLRSRLLYSCSPCMQVQVVAFATLSPSVISPETSSARGTCNYSFISLLRLYKPSRAIAGSKLGCTAPYYLPPKDRSEAPQACLRVVYHPLEYLLHPLDLRFGLARGAGPQVVPYKLSLPRAYPFQVSSLRLFLVALWY